MLLSPIVIGIYLSFILDLWIWPIPSETSTRSLLQTGNTSSIQSIGLLVRHLISLVIFMAPLAIAILKYPMLEQTGIMVIAGIGLALVGRIFSLFGSYMLRNKRSDLVTNSIFSITRHPIAMGMHFTLFGVILAVGEWPLWIGVPFYLWNMDDKIRQEEKLLEKQYGIKYRSYMVKTPRYLWK